MTLNPHLSIILNETDFHYLYYMINEAFEPEKNAPGDRIEVSLDSNQVVIRLSTLIDGLGWCSQKTMRLDRGVLDELFEQISDIKDHMTEVKAESEDRAANVIAFPNTKL